METNNFIKFYLCQVCKHAGQKWKEISVLKAISILGFSDSVCWTSGV